jgi:ferritin heavy chain
MLRLWERSAAECFADAHWLEKYLIQRGGRSNPTDITAPNIGISDTPIEPVAPVREALRVEREILEDLERLLSLASKSGDHSLEDVIETRFLRKETRHVKDLGDLLQQVVRVSKQPGHGLYQLDKELRRHKGRIPWGDANDPDIVNLAIQEATTSLQQGL